MDNNTRKPKKDIHIVFQVLNFLHSKHHSARIACPNMHRLLINLASHNGPKGICPTVRTIADELNLSEPTVRRLIRSWKDLAHLETIDNPGKPNGYLLYIPSPTPLASDTPLTTDTPLASERVPLSPVSETPLTSDHIYNKGTTKDITNKSSYMQNDEKHEFAESKDRMASEARHIKEHDERKQEYPSRRSVNNEPRPAMQFWGPGHPTWDSINGKKS